MREGGSIPVTLTFAEALRVNVLLLPMGRGDDGPQYVSSLPQQGLLGKPAVLDTVRQMKS
jgi:Cys-Gly metallodipeptidase DUG1